MFLQLGRPGSVIRTTLAEPLNRAGLRSGLSSGKARLPATAERISVVITIDAEIAPHTSDWQRDCGRFAADRDLYGMTEMGERGLRYQLDVIERHGVRAVVFLEALSAGVLGLDLLAEVTGLVQNRGHEVGLHIHTEWLPYYKRPLLGDRYGRNMSDFSEDDQVRLIDRGLENLSRAGAGPIGALRDGNAGASTATLRAARRSGIAIDSSYFAPHGEFGAVAVPRLLRLLERRVRAYPQRCLEPWVARGNPAATQFRAGSTPIARATAKGHASA